eukprot:403349744
MNISKQYEQALNSNIFLREEYKRNQENFVRRLINAESHLAQEIPGLQRIDEQREKYHSVKNNVKKFHDMERGNAISKQNALLIKNLMEISHGKRGNIPAPLKEPKRAASTKPKSLNDAVRRKEMERIAKENFDMVKRLHKGTSVISKRQHDGDFKNHQKYRKNLQKNTGQAILGNQTMPYSDMSNNITQQNFNRNGTGGGVQDPSANDL